ncbi:MAG TPA: helix-turn-helix domain-containing protein [Acidimicrobiales bacterium]|nr:helix-turn-helix domain-containing protein [Acidimicrobiales bacterium]
MALAQEVPGSVSGRLTRDQRREALLATAADLIAADADNLSMDSVAEAAGVSRPLLYKHFANRQELLVAVYRREASLLHEELASSVRGAKDLDSKFRALMHGALRAEAQRGAALKALRAAGGRDQTFREERQRRDRETVRYFSRIASGTLGTDERLTRKTISVLLRCMEGVLAEWRLKPTPANATWLEQIYVTMCMGALEAVPAAAIARSG